MPDESEVKPVYSDPDLRIDYTEDGNPFNETNCGWNIGWGCNLSFTISEDTGDPEVSVSTSDLHARTGHTTRPATREQIATFARMLLNLAGETPDTEWCVWYGGDDPNDCAGRQFYDDEGEAAEMVQWIVGGRLARRDVHHGQWTAVGESRG